MNKEQLEELIYIIERRIIYTEREIGQVEMASRDEQLKGEILAYKTILQDIDRIVN